MSFIFAASSSLNFSAIMWKTRAPLLFLNTWPARSSATSVSSEDSSANSTAPRVCSCAFQSSSRDPPESLFTVAAKTSLAILFSIPVLSGPDLAVSSSDGTDSIFVPTWDQISIIPSNVSEVTSWPPRRILSCSAFNKPKRCERLAVARWFRCLSRLPSYPEDSRLSLMTAARRLDSSTNASMAGLIPSVTYSVVLVSNALPSAIHAFFALSVRNPASPASKVSFFSRASIASRLCRMLRSFSRFKSACSLFGFPSLNAALPGLDAMRFNSLSISL